MKKWYICKYGLYHIQAPHLCTPIGIAFQKQQGDSESASGFIDVAAFSKWLEKNDLCAFGPHYAERLGIKNERTFPVMYHVK